MTSLFPNLVNCVCTSAVLLVSPQIASAQFGAFADLQEEAGSFVEFEGRVVTEKAKRVPESRLRMTCLITLSYLADGSTMRAGPYKKNVKRAVVWLRKQIDRKGAVAMRTDPQWFTDQALVLYTFAEAARLSRYRLLTSKVNPIGGFVVDYLQRKRVTVSSEMMFWCRGTLESLEHMPESCVERVRPLAKRLRAALGSRAKPAEKSAASECERGMAFYSLVRRTKDVQGSKAIAAAVAATLERCVDLTVLHPRALAMHTMAIYQVGGAAWKAWQNRLKTVLVDIVPRDGFGKDLWKSPSKDLGPMEASAWYTLAIECYYRCSLLQVARFGR